MSKTKMTLHERIFFFLPTAGLWGAISGFIAVVFALIVTLFYQSAHDKIEVVEVAQNLDMSRLRIENDGCKVTSPDGSLISLHEGKVFILKGSFITSECFATQYTKHP
jgi:hypothetical protein